MEKFVHIFCSYIGFPLVACTAILFFVWLFVKLWRSIFKK